MKEKLFKKLNMIVNLKAANGVLYARLVLTKIQTAKDLFL